MPLLWPDCLTNFFLPEAVPFTKVLLILSDEAAYMIKSASNLKIWNTRCRNYTIGVPISNGKKVFVKAPLRVFYLRKSFRPSHYHHNRFLQDGGHGRMLHSIMLKIFDNLEKSYQIWNQTVPS